MKNEYKCTVCGLIYHSNENKYPFNKLCYDCYHKMEHGKLIIKDDYLLGDGFLNEFKRDTVIPFSKAYNEIKKES